MQHHCIKEVVSEGELTVALVSSLGMLVDGMTKALSLATFRKHRALLGMVT